MEFREEAPNTTRYMNNTWIMLGVPLIMVRYTLQIAFKILNFPVLSCRERMIATVKPMITPTKSANNVTRIVTFRPFTSKSHRSSSIKF